MSSIQSVPDLCHYVREGITDWSRFGRVAVKEHNGLLLFNYTTECNFSDDWNAFELISRGLILDAKTGEVVALPYPKFFNWMQGERWTPARITRLTEKLDGSLGILYWRGTVPYIATRGSFDSDQALWGTDWLWSNIDYVGIPKDLTLLFEIIYPGNRIVVDYGEREELVLLDARSRTEGYYLDDMQLSFLARDFGFARPEEFFYTTPEAIASELPRLSHNMEGFVAWFEDGSIFKFKGAEYLRVHKLVTGLTPKKVRLALKQGEWLTLRGTLPDEFQELATGWVVAMTAIVNDTAQAVDTAFATLPKETRKDFALAVREQYPRLQHYLFAKYDDRPLTPMIFNRHDWATFDARILDKSLIGSAYLR